MIHVSELQNKYPNPVWKYFNEILKIPRPSKKEENIREYLVRFGRKRNLETLVDGVGNVLIRKTATPGYEDRIPVVLQSHMDMVPAKEPSLDFDFGKDPIPAYVEGNWVKTKGTTLGADDGIGVAAALAVLDAEDIQHGSLEALFTVDEESGMTGAKNLPEGWLKGKILINLDSEDEGELFIGCAGGQDTSAVFHLFHEPVPENVIPYRLDIKGLAGGHSGDEIDKGHANAIKLAARFLWPATQEYNIHLSCLTGGTLRNAIPPEAEAVFTIHESRKEYLIASFEVFRDTVREEFKHSDPEMKIGLHETKKPADIIPAGKQEQLLLSLYGCWHGVYSWSKTIPGLVQTSTNLALVRVDAGKIVVDTSQRSSLESEKKVMAETVASIFRLAGAEITFGDEYPGWTPNPESLILNITEKAYRELFHADPAVKAIHAGLECGLFLEKYPDMDMISFGPTIRGAHTPEEKLDLASTHRFWQLLVDVLKKIPASKRYL